MKLMHVLSVAALAAVSLTVAVRAGGDKVVFPDNYAKGVPTPPSTAQTTSSIASCTRRRRRSLR